MKIVDFFPVFALHRYMPSLLDEFRAYAKEKNISASSFIAGGTVRDFLLKLKPKDIDIAMKSAFGTAKGFAEYAKATFVPLDESFGTARVVKGGQHLDFAEMRGADIEEDLGARDITINAMAMPLAARRLIDPFGGSRDLAKGVIRMVSEKNLFEDPLRILRCYRFSAQFGFRIEKKTISVLRRLAPLLSCPAPERVTEEMRQVLLSSGSRRVLERMRTDGALRAVFPRVRAGNIRSVWALEAGIRRFPFSKKFAAQVDVFTLKLFLLLKGAGERGLAKLILSNRERELLERTRLREFFLKRLAEVNPRKETLVRILRDSGDEVYTYLLAGYSALKGKDSNGRAGQFLEFAKKLLELYIKEIKPRLGKRLVTGDDLIALGMRPGPEFKRILDKIEILWLEGKVKTREAALDRLKEILKKSLKSTLPLSSREGNKKVPSPLAGEGEGEG